MKTDKVDGIIFKPGKWSNKLLRGWGDGGGEERSHIQAPPFNLIFFGVLHETIDETIKRT